MNRRKLMILSTLGIGAAVGGVSGIPALIFAIDPALRRTREERWRALGRPEQFPVGQVTKAIVDVPRDDWAEDLRQQGVYVWRISESEMVVYSRSCTDLSCPVTFDPGSECFFCPCHGGIFKKDGQPIAGPPSRPLFRYAHRTRADGVIEIDLGSLPPMT